MGSSNTERQMTVPSYWEIGRLENKIAYKSNREATVGTVGAVGLTSLELALAPAVRRHHFGPNVRRHVAFRDAQNDVLRALRGEEPLSGDHYLKNQPEEYVERLAAEVRKGNVESLLDGPVGKLTQYVLAGLKKKQFGSEKAAGYYADWLDATKADYVRPEEQPALSAEELKKIYRKLGGAYNVHLALAGAELRTPDVSDDFGKNVEQLIALNYLESRWKDGRIHVPEEVLKEAWVDSQAPVDKAFRSPIIREWRDDTRSDAAKALKLDVYDLLHGEKDLMPGPKRAKRFLAREAIAAINND